MGIFTHKPSSPSIDEEFSDLLVEEEKRSNENGDHERFAHYVRKEKIVESAVTGKSVRALCGKKWIPSRDPEKFPICPTCKSIYEGLKKE
jgi:hypothetical protein